MAALGLCVGWLPNLLVGENETSQVEQLVLIAGFPIAAFDLAGWLRDEAVERRKI